MKKSLFVLLFAALGAHSAMAASILDAKYNKENEVVIVRVGYCTRAGAKPKAKLISGLCREQYPMSCDVTLVVKNEPTRVSRADTCVTERLFFDVEDAVRPAFYNFEANDGSRKEVFVGDDEQY